MASKEDCEYTTDALQLTTRLLDQNPEYYSIWNYRRLILQSLFAGGNPTSDEHDPDKVQQYIVSDLAFLLPLLRKFPKCYWIWNYRLWLLSEASRLLPTPATHQLWQQELSLVNKMLSLDGRNFHGWGYRRTVTSTLEQMMSMSAEADQPIIESMTETEFKYTTKMIETNLSNFSAWHRRSKLIPKLLNERNADHADRCQFLNEELQDVERALWADPDSKDQSLWFYHQYLISNFDARTEVNVICPDLPVSEKLDNLKDQIENLIKMLEGAESCKWIYQRLVDLALMSKAITGEWPVEFSDVETWVDRLLNFDPLRKGRWMDLKEQIVP
ncbi:MAG: hypothetical protein Q9183_002397 [Haloplaca sp. 2 TL-2023]